VAPAAIWLVVFFLAPLVQVVRLSFSADEFGLTAKGWSLGSYTAALGAFLPNLANSLTIGLLATTVAFLVGVPLAYGISFYGGRRRALLLFLAVAPFLTSYLVRVISWQTLLGASGPVLGPLKSLGLVGDRFVVMGTSFSVVAGLSYQLIPFVILPSYAAFQRVDRDLCAAAADLYSGRWGARGAVLGSVLGLAVGMLAVYTLSGRRLDLSPTAALALLAFAMVGALVAASVTESFLHVVLPLSVPGLTAAGVLTFIPALGDYVNAALLGNVRTQMLGNVIQTKFLTELDYAGAAALSSLLLAITLAILGLYLHRLRGTAVLDLV